LGARTLAADADAAFRVGAVARLFPGKVQWPDAGAAGARLVVQGVGGDDPRDLEFDAVRVPAVQRLRRAVVGAADQRTGGDELAPEFVQVGERVDLPGQVVQADRGPPGQAVTGGGADFEQPQVVVVGRGGSLEERGWLQRVECPTDKRGQIAVLTDVGFAALEEAAPGHVAAVRRHLIDRLTPQQVTQLERIGSVVVAGLESPECRAARAAQAAQAADSATPVA